MSAENELAKYRAYVMGVADGTEPTVILNRTAEHASVIVGILFSKAKFEVDILTGELNPRVYAAPEVIEAAANFLMREPAARICILSEKDIDAVKHPFLKALERWAPRIDVRVVPTEQQSAYRYHFAVADRRYWRFEQNRDSYEALVQFGDEKVGSQLQGIFDILKEKSRARVLA